MKSRDKIFKVKNKDRKFGADPEYVAMIVDGRKFLFTEEEIAAGERRAAKNAEDFPKPNFWQNLFK